MDLLKKNIHGMSMNSLGTLQEYIVKRGNKIGSAFVLPSNLNSTKAVVSSAMNQKYNRWLKPLNPQQLKDCFELIQQKRVNKKCPTHVPGQVPFDQVQWSTDLGNPKPKNPSFLTKAMQASKPKKKSKSSNGNTLPNIANLHTKFQSKKELQFIIGATCKRIVQVKEIYQKGIVYEKYGIELSSRKTIWFVEVKQSFTVNDKKIQTGTYRPTCITNHNFEKLDSTQLRKKVFGQTITALVSHGIPQKSFLDSESGVFGNPNGFGLRLANGMVLHSYSDGCHGTIIS